MPSATQAGLQGFHEPGPRQFPRKLTAPPMGLDPLQSTTWTERSLCFAREYLHETGEPIPILHPANDNSVTSFSEVCSPTVFPSARAAAFLGPRVPILDHLHVSRFSQPPDVLIRPCTVPALFRAGSTLGVHPPGLCSIRAAVRRLRRHSPHAGSNHTPLEPFLTALLPWIAPRPELDATRSARSQPTPGSCSARTSATRKRPVRPKTSTLPSWVFPPPGLSLSPGCSGSHRSSPHVVLHRSPRPAPITSAETKALDSARGHQGPTPGFHS